MKLDEFQRFVHQKIPITAQQGIGVSQFDGSGLSLTAPLSNNINDKGTAFAGSQYSLAVLAGWSFLMLYLDRIGLQGQVAIYKSSMDFNRPVQADYVARCHAPGPETMEQMASQLKRKGRARVELAIDLADAEGVAAVFGGHYALKFTP